MVFKRLAVMLSRKINIDLCNCICWVLKDMQLLNNKNVDELPWYPIQWRPLDLLLSRVEHVARMGGTRCLKMLIVNH